MTATNPFARIPQPETPFRLPDPPERHPDDMTSFDHLAATGSVHHLIQHLGNPDTTLVAGERYMVVRPTRRLAGSRYPDLLVALGVDPALYKASNGYIIEDQGKPPDFVLEIASPHTGHIDVGAKRDDYAALGIPEYWRFDETGEYHGARLRPARGRSVRAHTGRGNGRRHRAGLQPRPEPPTPVAARSVGVARPVDGPAHPDLRG